MDTSGYRYFIAPVLIIMVILAAGALVLAFCGPVVVHIFFSRGPDINDNFKNKATLFGSKTNSN